MQAAPGRGERESFCAPGASPPPRLIPLWSADSAPGWGRGPRSITVPSSAKCGAPAKSARGPRETRAAPVAPERPRSRPSISEVGSAGTRESPDSIGDASMVTKAGRRRSRPERLTAAARSRLRSSLHRPFVRGSVYAGPAQRRLGAGNRAAVEPGAEPGLWGRARRFRREGQEAGFPSPPV